MQTKTYLIVSGSLFQGPARSISETIANLCLNPFSFLCFSHASLSLRDLLGFCHAHSNYEIETWHATSFSSIFLVINNTINQWLCDTPTGIPQRFAKLNMKSGTAKLHRLNGKKMFADQNKLLRHIELRVEYLCYFVYVSVQQPTWRAETMLGNPCTMSTISQGPLPDVLHAPPLCFPILCWLMRRLGSTVNPMYVHPLYLGLADTSR